MINVSAQRAAEYCKAVGSTALLWQTHVPGRVLLLPRQNDSKPRLADGLAVHMFQSRTKQHPSANQAAECSHRTSSPCAKLRASFRTRMMRQLTIQNGTGHGPQWKSHRGRSCPCAGGL
jgi:hypothetical protein